MKNGIRSMAMAGILAIGGILGSGAGTASAQGFGYGPGFGGYGYGVQRSTFTTYRNFGYNPGYNPAAARFRGYREGERFIESGRLPNHRLSPAERQGFLSGERHEAREWRRGW